MEIVSKETISPTEVLSVLEGSEDPNEAQRETLEYLKKHLAVSDMDTLEELREELEALDTFKDDQILKIIETLPMSEREVRTLFSKERIKLEDSDIERVIEFSESVSSA